MPLAPHGELTGRDAPHPALGGPVGPHALCRPDTDETRGVRHHRAARAADRVGSQAHPVGLVGRRCAHRPIPDDAWNDSPHTAHVASIQWRSDVPSPHGHWRCLVHSWAVHRIDAPTIPLHLWPEACILGWAPVGRCGPITIAPASGRYQARTRRRAAGHAAWRLSGHSARRPPTRRAPSRGDATSRPWSRSPHRSWPWATAWSGRSHHGAAAWTGPARPAR